MLIEKNNSCLLVVDVQQKLAPLVLNHEHLIDNCFWLLSLAKELKVRAIITEQYPKGLGHTVDKLLPLIETLPIFEKVTFSVQADEKCSQYLKQTSENQVIVIGMETSVCILQTVLELIQDSKQVFVVVDAVSARHQLDHDLALERMKSAGAIMVTKEMVLFEWLRTSKAENFKNISKKYLQ